MQTTLLGLAIAFIIALIAALFGPIFVDWNQFRPQFEAEAARVIGSPVRVEGALDARLLPTPTLRLKSVSIGSPNDPSKARADKLDVEFSLSSLMRGEWRASELSLQGLALDFGLDKRGRIDWPASRGYFDFGSLAIDRLNLAGRIVLHDAASGGQLAIDDLKFSGDVRALAGTLRGEGSATISGTRVPFRISSGQTSDNKGARVRLIVDPGQRPLSADLDGVLTFDAQAPRFDGALTLARTSPMPWRLTSRVKADPSAATFTQVEASYGQDDVALNLSGTGDLRFGPSPLLHVALSAQQLDADRLLTKGQTDGVPVQLVPGLRSLIAAFPLPPLPMQVDLSADQIALGGRPVKNLAAAFHSTASMWSFDSIELQAPGASQVAARGTLSGPGDGAQFTGPIEVESGDPAVLLAWLQGRSDIAFRNRKLLRVTGNATVGADRFALDAMKADLDGGTLEGNVSVSSARFDAALKSSSFDLDTITDLARALAGPRASWPQEARLSFDAARATLAGQDIRPVGIQFAYGPKSISLDRLKIGGASGVAIDGSGALDREAATGKLTLSATAASLAQFGNLIAPMAPAVAARLKSIATASGGAHAKLSVDLSQAKDNPGRTSARAVLELDTAGVKGSATLTTSPFASATASLDLDALAKNEMTLESKLTSQQGQTLLKLAGADGIVAAGNGPAQFEISMKGMWRGPLQFKVKLIGSGLDGDAQGSGDPWASDPKAAFTLAVRQVDLAPLFDLKPSVSQAFRVSLSSRLALADDKLTFDGLDGTFGGSRIRGRLVVTRGDVAGVDGEIGMDSIDLASVIGLAFGAAGHDAGEPFNRGWVQGWRGQVAFQALRGDVPGGTELRPVSGVFRGDGQSFILDGLKAGVGGGEATATIEGRQTAEGLAVSGRAQFAGVDGAALKYRGLAMPKGRTALQMTVASRGRSSAALSGALAGNGVVSLEDAEIAGLDPRAFDIAIGASDTNQAPDDRRLKAVVDPALSQGALQVASAQISFDIRDGRLRVGPTTLNGNKAGVVVSGGYDFFADQADMRAALSSNTARAESVRPEIQIFLHGTPDALDRDVDVASLSSWLALRAIDRETRRLDRLERGELPLPPAVPSNETTPQSEAIAPSDVRVPSSDPRKRPPIAKPPAATATIPPRLPDVTASDPRVSPLPPPIDIRPAPGVLHQQKPRSPSTPAPAAPRASF